MLPKYVTPGGAVQSFQIYKKKKKKTIGFSNVSGNVIGHMNVSYRVHALV